MAHRPTGKILRAIVENMSDAAIGIDKDGKILILNRQFRSIFDELSDEEIVGKKIWDVLEINDFTRSFISLVKESEPTPLEQMLPFPGNRVFLVKMLPVRGHDNRIVGALAILRDLTEMHRMELTVNEFVSMVSHELKTPLTSIKGFVETLLEGALNNPEVTRRFLQVINEETNRMTRLVINLLDLSNMLQQDRAEEVIQPVNTSQFIREGVKLFEPIAREKGIVLDTRIPDNLPAIEVNPDRLRQVLLNLIDNALKYTGIKGAGGTVTVKVEKEEDKIKVSVSDTGVGIPPDEKDKIFEKFYRVTSGPASQLGGTGLGLSITSEIIKTYGGEIFVESKVDEGSTFTFTIPVISRKG